MNGVEREGTFNQSYSTGIGYITIPTDADRDSFIETCFRRERIAIQLDEGGSIIQNCHIDKDVLQKIDFPKDKTDLGSCVVYICDRFIRKPIIIGVISKRNESQLLRENSFKRSVKSDSGRVYIEGKAKDGNLFIDVQSDFLNGGSVFITLKSKDNTSKFDVKCFGNVDIYAEKDITSETLATINLICNYVESGVKKLAASLNLNQDGFLYNDKDGNKIEIKDKSINIKPNSRFNIFNGGSPLVKGDELAVQLAKVTGRIDGIMNVLKTAPSGTIGAYATYITGGLGQITDAEDFSDINSDKSFTD